MFKWIGGIFLCLVLALAICLWFIPKKYAENILEKYFGMDVFVGHVFYNPSSHDLTIKNLRFSNQDSFSSSDHLRVDELQAKINLRQILDQKYVEIERLYLQKPYFLIEKNKSHQKTSTNIGTWLDHLKRAVKEKSNSQVDRPKNESPKWRVSIKEIKIKEGIFEYDGHEDNDYFLSDLKGTMEGFDWPTTNPHDLNQDLILKGRFGKVDGAPFKIQGEANFATKLLNFQLKANAEDANLMEYKRFLENFPINFKSGRFDLFVDMKCVDGFIDTKTELKLHHLKVKPETKITDFILGIPMLSAVKFIETEKSIVLNVSVSGKITDPDFKFEKAFREAFQQALTTRLFTGAKMIMTAPIKIAGGATKQVEKATDQVGKVTNQMGKATTKQIENTANEAVGFFENVASKVIPGGKKDDE